MSDHDDLLAALEPVPPARRRGAAAAPADDADDGAGIIAAADRKRRGRRARNPSSEALDALAAHEETPPEGYLVDADADAGSRAIEKRKPRRKPLKGAARAGVFNAVDQEPEAMPSDKGALTRGIHAGLDGAQKVQSGMRRAGPWGVAAAAVITVLVLFSFYAGSQIPDPIPVTNVRVDFLPGPRLAQGEVIGWLRAFPYRDKLGEPQPWVLDKLAAWLRQVPAVGEVRQVVVVHEPLPGAPDRLRRTLALELGLRQPVMPVVLASGERAWLDAEGRVLPGILPGPAVRRPLVRALEQGGLEAARAALDLWARLEPQIEPGLVTDIHLADVLDAKGASRGIVLYTRQGSRLVWGNPAEERFGVKPDDKVRDLVHAIRCQGDLGRVALINVRFRQPFLVMRDGR